MISRIDFDSWQMVFPAIGIILFILVFAWAVACAVRLNRKSRDHLGGLPLEKETPRPANTSHVRPDAHQ